MKKEVFNKYADGVSTLFSISKGDLFEKSKHRDIVNARYLLYYLCFNRPMAITKIQEFMDENGYKVAYSNVKYGVDAMKKKVRRDADYKQAYKNLRDV